MRKFVCTTPTCPRQIFTERLPNLVQSYARMTNRLREALIALGLATSAQVSERLAPKLAMRVSAPTLLRRLRAVDCPGGTRIPLATAQAHELCQLLIRLRRRVQGKRKDRQAVAPQ